MRHYSRYTSMSTIIQCHIVVLLIKKSNTVNVCQKCNSVHASEKFGSSPGTSPYIIYSNYKAGTQSTEKQRYKYKINVMIIIVQPSKIQVIDIYYLFHRLLRSYYCLK